MDKRLFFEPPVISSTLRWQDVSLPASITEADLDRIIFSVMPSRQQKTAAVMTKVLERCVALGLRAVAQQAAGGSCLATVIHRGNRMPRAERNELGAAREKRRIGADQKRAARLQRGGGLDFGVAAGFQHVELHAERCRGLLE